MMYWLILPNSKYRDYTGIFNDSTENTKDADNAVHDHDEFFKNTW